jgi:hypothetical protein
MDGSTDLKEDTLLCNSIWREQECWSRNCMTKKINDAVSN